ncbi:PRD domain-containing protein [Caproiciproducens sp. CPB-2]|uniref:PRD domain-containing protein n=1 Tax=Caproiciproducens sp. CPB-2 TaxID=3030017 RepID=UPI0023D978BF|nr:PRD domain-containing protein [Caproiciproducens sp. CPB-2]MDF1494546.1 PRD domain-containing protein [Caproiciproducens sp. CPB-2]
MNETQKNILDYVAKITMKYNENNFCMSNYSADAISKILLISRSLVSKYLNDFFKEGILIKISSRPVLFLFKKMLEENFKISFNENEFLSLDNFNRYLQENSRSKKDFENAIGSQGSLFSVINQCKACAEYSSKGLPVILYGEPGVGKKFLGRCFYEYLKNKHLTSEEALFEEYIFFENGNWKDTEKNIFGSISETEGKKKYLPGALSRIKDGVLCIGDIKFLPPELISKFKLLLTDNVFYPYGERNTSFKSHARLVFFTEKETDARKIEELLQYIPSICKIPNLKGRYPDEKEELIIHALLEQEILSERKIFISSKALQVLNLLEYPQNIISIQSTIRKICMMANVIKGQDHIEIYTYNIPEELQLQSNITENSGKVNDSLIAVDNYQNGKDTKRLFWAFGLVFEVFEKLKIGVYSDKDFIHKLIPIIKDFENCIPYSNCSYLGVDKYFNDQRIVIVINRVLQIYHVSLPANISLLVSNIIFSRYKSDHDYTKWEQEKRGILEEILTYFESNYVNSTFIIDKIDRYLRNNLEIKLDNGSKIILNIVLMKYEKSSEERKYLSIIVAHGYATASSIAKLANSLLGEYFFEAVDVEYGTPVDETINQIEGYIQRFSMKSDVLLIVDMGSLEKIGEELSNRLNRNLVVINNLSAKLAIDIGTSILNGKDIPEIIEKDAKDLTPEFKLFKKQSVQDAVVFTSENGTVMAERMMKLFRESLPREIDVIFTVHDFSSFMKSSTKDKIFEQYHVLFVAGTSNPNLPEEKFLTLDDMVEVGNIGKISRLLGGYLEPNQLDELKQNLLKNFTLNNVINYLTILDPKKVLDSVLDALGQMQEHLAVPFNGASILGLTVHLCCMIERLVRKEAIGASEDIDEFIKEKSDFIAVVNISFSDILDNYNISIPTSEIKYIYNYVAEDLKRAKQGNPIS